MDLNRLSSQIIKAAITVHKELGPGLLESVNHACMLIEPRNMRIKVQSEVMLPVVYIMARRSTARNSGLIY